MRPWIKLSAINYIIISTYIYNIVLLYDGIVPIPIPLAFRHFESLGTCIVPKIRT